jgi:hypothetical protein
LIGSNGAIMSSKEYRFATDIRRFDVDLKHHYIVVPGAVADALLAAGTRRVAGRINGHPVRRALQNRRNGERFLILGQGLLRDIGVEFGDTVDVIISTDSDPDFVETGEELAEVLEQDEEAAARWNAMTPGRQRSLALYVTTARRTETRIKRALELAERIRTNTLYGDRER